MIVGPHNHSPSVIPFGVTGKELRPLMHMCASIGHEVSVWDTQNKFGDTALLVTDMAMGRDLAQMMGAGRTVLMRGHGAVVAGRSIREAVFISCYSGSKFKTSDAAMALGEVTYLSKGEVDAIIARTGPFTINRAWENWCGPAGRDIIVWDNE